MKKLLLLAALFGAVTSTLRADTSYLLVQGDFDSSNAGVETYLWKVLYQRGSLSTGQDLLNSVFGLPSDTGTSNDGVHPYLVSTRGNLGAAYDQFSFGLALESLTISGAKLAKDEDLDIGWNYFVAGGGGEFATATYEPGDYPAGSWQFSNDGAGTRTLSDGSFDAWAFGQRGYFLPGSTSVAEGDPGEANAPEASNFAAATAVPEPGTSLLLLLGLAGFFTRKRR